MTTGFSVPALGKGSVASFVKVALDIAWVLLWIGAAALALGALAYFTALVLIQAGVLPAAILEPGEATIHLGPVKVQTGSDDQLVLPLMAPAFLAAAVAVGGALIIVLRLKRLFKNFTSGAPFSADNAGHLRVIWVTMTVMELSRYVIAGAIAAFLAIAGQPAAAEIHVDAPVNLMTWGAIFVLIVLAEVFREGARLQAEQELTI